MNKYQQLNWQQVDEYIEKIIKKIILKQWELEKD